MITNLQSKKEVFIKYQIKRDRKGNVKDLVNTKETNTLRELTTNYNMKVYRNIDEALKEIKDNTNYIIVKEWKYETLIIDRVNKVFYNIGVEKESEITKNRNYCYYNNDKILVLY